MRAINEANLSVAMKPRRSQDLIEVEARRTDDTVERKIHLKRVRGNMHEQAISYGQERGIDGNEDWETEKSELETSSNGKVIGDQEKPQVCFENAFYLLQIIFNGNNINQVFN